MCYDETLSTLSHYHSLWTAAAHPRTRHITYAPNLGTGQSLSWISRAAHPIPLNQGSPLLD